MSIIQRVPWNVQPQIEVGINYGNPLTAGLTSVVKGRGSPLRNQISNSVLGSTGTVSTGAIGPRGLAGNAATESGNSSWQDGLSGTLLSTTGATVLAIVKKTDSTNRQSSLFYHGDATAGTPGNFFNLHFPWSDGSVYADFGGISGSNRISYAGQSFGTDLVVIFAAGAGGSRILVNGVVKASQTSALTRTDGNTTTQWNQYVPASSGFRSDRINLTLGCVWKRELNLAECLTLSNNPWQIFAPLSRRIWAPSAGGGPTYTLPASTTSFALSGTATSLKFNRALAAVSGSFLLSGTNASLKFNRVLSAGSGVFLLTGTNSTLTYSGAGGPTYTITASNGNFALTGTNVTFKRNRVIQLGTGSFTLNGTNATLTYSGAPAPGGAILYLDLISGKVLLLKQL